MSHFVHFNCKETPFILILCSCICEDGHSIFKVSKSCLLFYVVLENVVCVTF